MYRNIYYILVLSLTALLMYTGCKEAPSDPAEEAENDILSGGETTVFISGSLAFSSPAANLSGEQLERFLAGDLQFEQSFVKSPAIVNPGLGPLFNNNSCINCHISDGRGRPPFNGGTPETMLFRISIPGAGPHGEPNPVPGFGGQLQDKSIIGYLPEGSVAITYTVINGNYPDGTPYRLYQPVYAVSGRIPSDVLLSPRVAPSVFGSGLLEVIPEQAILTYEDINDRDGDGISGKANYVWNFVSGKEEIGRFGWKANTPTLIQQVAAAYVNDMGVTSPVFTYDNDYGYPGYDTTGDDPELPLKILEDVTFYTQTLGVPARRNYDKAEVKAGKKIFNTIGCNSCHVTEFKTGVNTAIPELSNQKIHPYTDMLLHDMGDALADNRPDYRADGNEWRTPPLWGIGLVEIVNGHNNFMHDGRAQSLEEAILWHGGESEKAKLAFMNLTKSDREFLIKFLKSL